MRGKFRTFTNVEEVDEAITKEEITRIEGDQLKRMLTDKPGDAITYHLQDPKNTSHLCWH